jgi:ADP-ribosylation factor-like protein 2
LKGALTLPEISELLNLKELGETGRHWNLIACSAQARTGIDEGFQWIVGDVASRIYSLN